MEKLRTGESESKKVIEVIEVVEVVEVIEPTVPTKYLRETMELWNYGTMELWN